MNKYVKVIVGAAGFAVLMFVSTVLYNRLKDEYAPDNLVEMNTGEDSLPSEDETGEDRDSQHSGEVGLAGEEAGGDGSEEVPEEGNSDSSEEGNSDSPGDGQETEASPAIDFTVLDRDGEEVTLYSLIGKPVVLNFWASWCPPCVGEMPEFQKVYEELGEEVQFVMVNMTDGGRETRSIAEDFLDKEGYTFPVYFDEYLSAANAYYVTSLPSTYFINSKGELAAGARGAIDEETLLKGISMIQEERREEAP